jgi:hypothetical protein
LCEPCFRKNEEVVAELRGRGTDKQNLMTVRPRQGNDTGLTDSTKVGGDGVAAVCETTQSKGPAVCLASTTEPAPVEMSLASIPASYISAEIALNNKNSESGCGQQNCERLIHRIDQLTSTIATQSEIMTKLPF